jgi:hypothetical protein
MYNNELYIASQGVHKYDSNLNYCGTCGLENKYVCNILIKDNYLFAGTNADGVWQVPLSVITSIKNTEPLENSIDIFPNPTTGILNIGTALPDYEINVFDMNGLLVLKDRNRHAIDVSDFSKGLYVIRLQDLNTKSIITKKFILE